MPNRFHSTLILVIVFVLGTSAGVGAMVWAWPGIKAKFFPAHRDFVETERKALNLSATQSDQMQAVFKELQDSRHQLHLQFVPQYTKICDDYKGVRTQERAAWTPISQQETAKFKGILTDLQWQKWQQQMQQDRKAHPPTMRVPDLCKPVGGPVGGSPSGGPGVGGPLGGGSHPDGPHPDGHFQY